MKTRILLFEDDEGTRSLLCAVLRQHGYEVLDFPSPTNCALIGRDASTCPRASACADILITDMNMPEMSGLEMVRYQQARGCNIPAANKLVLSANLTAEQEEAFREMGFTYLRKPFHIAEILAWIARCEENIEPGRSLVPVERLTRDDS